MKTEFFEVTVYVTGIKKKERSTKKHGLRLSNVVFGTTDTVEFLGKIKEEAKQKINESMREVPSQKCRIVFTYCYTESNEPDVKMMEPFSEHNFSLEVEV